MYRYDCKGILEYKRILLLLLYICSVSLTTSAQKKKVSVVGDDIDIKHAFKQIQEQTGYSFAYNSSKFNASKRINISMYNANIEDVLECILRDTGYTYTFKRNRIFLSPAPAQTKVAPQTPIKIVTPVVVLKDTVASVRVPQKDGNIPDIVLKEQTSLPITHSKKQEVNTELILPHMLDTIEAKNKQAIAFKTNLLYDITSTINVGTEIKISDRYTIDLSVSYNPWTYSDNMKWKHLLIQPELRYWLHKPFSKHFFGLHIHYASYNIGNLAISRSLKGNRYEGNLFGAGLSYGYQWQLSSRFRMESTIGFGYSRLDYKRYECQTCGPYNGSSKENHWSPTKAAVSLIYMIK